MIVSSIYRGHVRHERWKPAGNRFTYSMYMMYLELDEVDRVFGTGICVTLAYSVAGSEGALETASSQGPQPNRRCTGVTAA